MASPDLADFALAHETPWPRDLRAHLDSGFFEPPPDNEVIGPTAPRGGPNGLVIHRGRRVAAWGDTRQVDMTFSVAKSYLALLAGIAVADRLLTDLDEPVAARMKDGGFDDPHNAAVTWRHLLTNTSEWAGTLFGKSDVIDRGRNLGVEGQGAKRSARPLHAPGAYWEYNDVRVNRLSLSLLHLFGRELPEVFRERIMDPIGASSDWRWEAYDNATVEVNGSKLRSVPGGGHWGGGIFIHAEDQALVGRLAAQDGVWEGKRLLPEGWIAQCTAPCPLNPQYGFLFWLNTGRTKWPAASERAFGFSGAGGNLTFVEPGEALVAVARWLAPAAQAEFVAKALASA
jgi:CubicO group peptidase (beta-lactamase class C family)